MISPEQDPNLPENKQKMFQECLDYMMRVAMTCQVPPDKCQEVAIEAMEFTGALMNHGILELADKRMSATAMVSIYCAGFRHGTGDLEKNRRKNGNQVGEMPDFKKHQP